MIQNKIRTLNPKSVDTKYTGLEPSWSTVSPESRRSDLMRALQWYNYHYDKKVAKQCVLDWLHETDPVLQKKFARTADSAVPYQLGWLCRMNQRGLTCTEHEHQDVTKTIQELVNKTDDQLKKPSDTVTDTAQPNIQDRLRSKAHDIAGELEGLYDDMIRNDVKMTADHKPIAVIRGMGYPPQMLGHLKDAWQQRLDELLEVQAGTDGALVEAYGNYSKIQMRPLVKFAARAAAPRR